MSDVRDRSGGDSSEKSESESESHAGRLRSNHQLGKHLIHVHFSKPLAQDRRSELSIFSVSGSCSSRSSSSSPKSSSTITTEARCTGKKKLCPLFAELCPLPGNKRRSLSRRPRLISLENALPRRASSRDSSARHWATASQSARAPAGPRSRAEADPGRGHGQREKRQGSRQMLLSERSSANVRSCAARPGRPSARAAAPLSPPRSRRRRKKEEALLCWALEGKERSCPRLRPARRLFHSKLRRSVVRAAGRRCRLRPSAAPLSSPHMAPTGSFRAFWADTGEGGAGGKGGPSVLWRPWPEKPTSVTSILYLDLAKMLNYCVCVVFFGFLLASHACWHTCTFTASQCCSEIPLASPLLLTCSVRMG